MFETFIFICLCSWSLVGVFGVDEVKSVSVMEGDSVTLHINDTDIQKDDLIMWKFGNNNILIALLNRNNNESNFYSNSAAERFRDRLKLDHQTGSLTITNTRTTDSGLYTVTSSRAETPLDTFNLTVYDNPIRNQTRHLNISEVCHTCSEHGLFISNIVLISAAAAGFLLIVVTVMIFCTCRKHKVNKEDQTCTEEITYSETAFYKRNPQKLRDQEEEEVVYAGIAVK